MYDAGTTYINNMFTFDRMLSLQLNVQYNNGLSETLYDEDIVENSFDIDLACTNNNSFGFGASIMNICNISLLNKKSVVSQFEGAVIEVYIKAQESANSETVVSIPMGVYDVISTEVVDTDNNVRLKCYDFMNRFNIKNKEGATGRLYNILSRICYLTGITFGMTKAEVEAFPGASVSYVLGGGAFESFRDMIEYCAEIMCGFATMDRYGRLVIRKFGVATNKTIPESFISSRKTDNITFTISELQYNGTPELVEQTGVQDGYIVDYCTDNKMFSSLWVDFKLERETVIEEAAEFVADVAFKGAELNIWGDPILDLGDSITVANYGNIVIMHITYGIHGLQAIGCYGVAKDSFSGTTKAGRSIVNIANSQSDIRIDIKKFGVRHKEVPKHIDALDFNVVLECSDYKIIMDGATSESGILNNYAVVASDDVVLCANPTGGTGAYFYALYRNVDDAGWVTVGENLSFNTFLEHITSSLNIYTKYKVICRDLLNNEVTKYYSIATVSTVANIPPGAVEPDGVLEFTNINTSVPSNYTDVMRETIETESTSIMISNTVTVYAEQPCIMTYFNTFSTSGIIQNTPLVCKQELLQGYNSVSWVDCLLFTKLPDNLLVTIGVGVDATACVHVVDNGSHMELLSLFNKKLVPQPPVPEEHKYVFKNISITIDI